MKIKCVIFQAYPSGGEVDFMDRVILRYYCFKTQIMLFCFVRKAEALVITFKSNRYRDAVLQNVVASYL